VRRQFNHAISIIRKPNRRAFFAGYHLHHRPAIRVSQTQQDSVRIGLSALCGWRLDRDLGPDAALRIDNFERAPT
jgi:hypothetical protein